MIHQLLLRGGMRFYQVRYWGPLERMSRHPRKVQQNVLQALMRANRDTHFGVAHGFTEIRTHADYQARVPAQYYETLRPHIELQRLTGAPALTAAAPLFYTQTSGTTGSPKLIPITPVTLAQYRAEQALFSWLQYRACPEAFRGKAMGIMGAVVERRLDSGHAVGAVSGHLYTALPAAIQNRFVVPPAVSGIEDYELKYRVIVRLALAHPDITYLGSPNPSTFLRLQDTLNTQRESLLHSLKTGTMAGLDTLPVALRQCIAQRIRPDPVRADQLRRETTLSFAKVWPGIRLLTTWTGGSCGVALERLRGDLPPDARVMELGYQSSECRGSLALALETPGGLPPLHHHFFEFVEQTNWDDGKPMFLGLDQLESGARYYILVTTAAGLYRYFMNDLVEVTGFFHCTPLLRFVQKGRGVTSITGEKLYEAQVIDAVRDVARHHNQTASFFLMLADEAAMAYRLYIEIGIETDKGVLPDAPKLAAAIDLRLGELNIEYQAKRASGRLAPLTLLWLKPGTAEAYKAAWVQAGQREGQFKPVLLLTPKTVPLALDDYVMR